jgi:hypothetical protein
VSLDGVIRKLILIQENMDEYFGGEFSAHMPHFTSIPWLGE